MLVNFNAGLPKPVIFSSRFPACRIISNFELVLSFAFRLSGKSKQAFEAETPIMQSPALESSCSFVSIIVVVCFAEMFLCPKAEIWNSMRNY